MDLELAPDERAFLSGFDRFLDRHLPKRLARGPKALEAVATGDLAQLHAWQRTLHAAGYVGVSWPEAYGGRGLPAHYESLLDEALVRRGAPHLVGMLGVRMLGPTLIRWGTEAQKRRFLPKVLTGEELWCQGYSEPGAGSDLASLRTSAVRDGDHYVVNGQKIWTTNAQISRWMFALVRTDAAAPKHRGISYLLIDLRSPGVSVRPLVQMTKDAGFNEVFFDAVRVPAANLVGPENEGWAVANTTLVHEREMLGLPSHTRNLFDGVVSIARRVRRDGRPAIEDPAVRRRIAALRIEVEAMRLHALRGLTRRLQGRPEGIEASVTKLATTSLNHRLAAAALEILGAEATLYRGDPRAADDGFWPRELMHSLGMIIGGGTAQIQKNLIAQRGLGLPRGA